MAITVYGVPESITAKQWSELFKGVADGGGSEVVDGFAPSVATGTRKVTIAAGQAFAVGTRIVSTTTTEVTLDEVTSGARLDMICLQVDWNGTTQSNAGTIVVVKGVPLGFKSALERTPGDKWQIPLAGVLMLAGVGQLEASAVIDYRPGPRRTRIFRPTVEAKSITSPSGASVTIASYTVPSPGYDYHIRVSAAVNMSATSQGHGRIQLRVGSNTVRGVSGGTRNPSPAVIPGWRSAPQPYYTTTPVELWMSPQSMGSNELSSYSTYSFLQIEQEPA